jgi:hypothetical protein
MSRHSLVYLAALVAILGGGLVVAHLTRATGSIEIQPAFFSEEKRSYRPCSIPQLAKERLWKPFALQKVLSIEGIKQTMDVKDDAEGNIYIFDWRDFQIKKFSKEGKLVGLIGTGNGTNPGQFVNPTGFDLAGDGKMWVCDPKGVITIFDPSGEVTGTLSTRNPAMRIAHGKDQAFVIMASPRAAYLWEEYTDSGEFQRAFGELIEDQSQNALSLMGWMAGDGSDTFYYAAYYPGIIASYNMSGELRFFAQTIDPKPLPKIEITPKGVKKIQYQKAEVSALGIGVSGEVMYVLTELASSNQRKAIDAYSKHDGSYLYSSEMPDSADQIFFTNNALYTVTATTVTKWQFEK